MQTALFSNARWTSPLVEVVEQPPIKHWRAAAVFILLGTTLVLMLFPVLVAVALMLDENSLAQPVRWLETGRTLFTYLDLGHIVLALVLAGSVLRAQEET